MKQGTQRVRRKAALPRSRSRTWKCERDGNTVTNGYCPSCELYNAAVHAQRTAAQYIAKQKAPGAKRAWLNAYGVFAWVDGVAVQLGTPEEAAPFSGLTTATILVTKFREPPPRSKVKSARSRSRK